MATPLGTTLGTIAGEAVKAVEIPLNTAVGALNAALDGAQALGPEEAQKLIAELNGHIDSLQAIVNKAVKDGEALAEKASQDVSQL